MPRLPSRLRHSRVSTPRRSGGLLMQPSEVGNGSHRRTRRPAPSFPLFISAPPSPSGPRPWLASSPPLPSPPPSNCPAVAATSPLPPQPRSPPSSFPSLSPPSFHLLPHHWENVDNHIFPWKNNRLFFCRHSFLPYFCTPKNTLNPVSRVRFRSSVGRAIHF